MPTEKSMERARKVVGWEAECIIRDVAAAIDQAVAEVEARWSSRVATALGPPATKDDSEALLLAQIRASKAAVAEFQADKDRLDCVLDGEALNQRCVKEWWSNVRGGNRNPQQRTRSY